MRILALLSAFALAACVTGSGGKGNDPAVSPDGGSSGGVVSAGSEGYLEGTVSIGPLRPVETVDGPPPTAPAEAYTSRSINVFREDGATLVRNVGIQANGTYRTPLAPGRYVVDLARRGKFERANTPATVTVAPGRTVRLDIQIDTGMR